MSWIEQYSFTSPEDRQRAKEAQLAEIMRLVSDYGDGRMRDGEFGEDGPATDIAYTALESAVRKALGL
jgi:hypothetical protein